MIKTTWFINVSEVSRLFFPTSADLFENSAFLCLNDGKITDKWYSPDCVPGNCPKSFADINSLIC